MNRLHVARIPTPAPGWRTIPVFAAGAWVGLFLGASSALAQVRAPSFDEFKLINSRNIFDPNRRAVRREEPREPRVEARGRPNWLMLTGTLVSEGRALAFFNSSRSDCRKVVSVGESIGEFKVIAITPLQVEWEQNSRRSVLAVGRQVPIEGTTTEPEAPAPTIEPVAPSPSPASGAPSGETPAPPPAGNKNEILRRMMERRAQEMNSK